MIVTQTSFFQLFKTKLSSPLKSRILVLPEPIPPFFSYFFLPVKTLVPKNIKILATVLSYNTHTRDFRIIPLQGQTKANSTISSALQLCTEPHGPWLYTSLVSSLPWGVVLRPLPVGFQDEHLA